ncbi:MAG: hypothetical protein OHK0029_04060 [Armatimonadaceae bacterium]
MLRHLHEEEQGAETLSQRTARATLARASELQAQEQERVSPESLEAMAEDLGIESRYVHQALAERKQQRRRVRVASRSGRSRILGRATRSERLFAAGIPIFYGMHIFLTALLIQSPSEELITLLCFVLPQILAAFVGMALAKKRMAAVSGGLINAFTILGLAAAMRITDGHPVRVTGEDFLIMLAMISGGAFTATVTAGLRQAIQRRD